MPVNGELTDALKSTQLFDFKVVRGRGFEPLQVAPLDPKNK